MFKISCVSLNLSISDITKPFVLSFENKLETEENSQTFKQTLDNNNWEYVFINTGIEFTGVVDKINGYYSYLKTLPDEKIVIISDARDVLCCRSPRAFIDGLNHLNKSENKLLISTELYLLGQMNWTQEQINEKIKQNPNYFYQGTFLTKYWEYYKYETLPDKKYVNSGLIAGKVSQLKHMFNWIIENNYTDDQLGVANYVNNFPQFINLDITNEMLHTSTFALNGGVYDIHIQKRDCPTIAEILGFSSFFLHFPGLNSKGQMMCYSIVKETILNNYDKIWKLYNRNNNDIDYFPNFSFTR
jgi:hypothetical protein